jgi:hypothetical protein
LIAVHSPNVVFVLEFSEIDACGFSLTDHELHRLIIIIRSEPVEVRASKEIGQGKGDVREESSDGGSGHDVPCILLDHLEDHGVL